MELFQGEEATHDFLSLRAGASSPFHHGHRGATSTAADVREHVLPGGVGTFSIRQVPDAQSREEASMGRDAHLTVPDGAAMETGSGAVVRTAPSTMWQDSGIDQRSRATRPEGRSSGSSADQGPSSPRSKHSATEQRRRTKINDRLDILRELLPNCDQKRDKASFLMEVIEYIRLLQEKVEKYESDSPEKNHVDPKSMPWEKVYYRSRWRNTESISQVQGGGLSATAEDTNKEQYNSKGIRVAPASLFSTQSVKETSTTASSSRIISENSVPRNQPPWLSMSTMNQDSDASKRMLTKHEKQNLHDDTQSLSSAYSQGLLHKLTEALKKSGVDPSQAHISVEINMDKRARPYPDINDTSEVNEGKEPVHLSKRLRCDRN